MGELPWDRRDARPPGAALRATNRRRCRSNRWRPNVSPPRNAAAA